MSNLRDRLHTALKTAASEIILGKQSTAQQWEQVSQHQQIILNKFADSMLDVVMPIVEDTMKQTAEIFGIGPVEAEEIVREALDGDR